MPVIKASQSAPLVKSAVVLDLGDLSRQAEAILAAARQEAQTIIRQAQEEARRIATQSHAEARAQGLAEGRREGFQQGLREGRQQALEEARPAFQALEKRWLEALEHWDAQRQDLHRQACSAVLELAVKLAEKIVHRCIEVDPSIVVDQVAAALEYLLHPADVTIRIHPKDRPVLEEALPALMKRFAQVRHAHLVEDPGLTPGGCLLSFGHGSVDARLQTQLRRIAELLLPQDTQTLDRPANPGAPDSP